MRFSVDFLLLLGLVLLLLSSLLNHLRPFHWQLALLDHTTRRLCHVVMFMSHTSPKTFPLPEGQVFSSTPYRDSIICLDVSRQRGFRSRFCCWFHHYKNSMNIGNYSMKVR